MSPLTEHNQHKEMTEATTSDGILMSSYHNVVILVRIGEYVLMSAYRLLPHLASLFI